MPSHICSVLASFQTFWFSFPFLCRVGMASLSYKVLSVFTFFFFLVFAHSFIITVIICLVICRSLVSFIITVNILWIYSSSSRMEVPLPSTLSSFKRSVSFKDEHAWVLSKELCVKMQKILFQETQINMFCMRSVCIYIDSLIIYML